MFEMPRPRYCTVYGTTHAVEEIQVTICMFSALFNAFICASTCVIAVEGRTCSCSGSSLPVLRSPTLFLFSSFEAL
jgi:hypothetical protein